MAYELLDRAGLAKVVTQISTKVNTSLGNIKTIEVIDKGDGTAASQKIYYDKALNRIVARPESSVLNLAYSVSGPTVNTVNYNAGDLYYSEPEYLSGTSSYEKAYEYLAIGPRAGAGPYGTAIGSNAEAWNDYSIAVGTRAFAGASTSSSYSRAFGDLMPAAKSKYRKSGSTAVGAYAQAGGACTSVGRSAYAWLSSGTAIGAAANAGGEYGTSLGNNATSASTGSTALGSRAAASAKYATAIGYKAAVSANGYQNGDQDYSQTSPLLPTSEENLSVALGAFSTVRPGQNDVVSVGSEMQDIVRNYFNGVYATQNKNYQYAYDWVSETTERSPFYRRIVNVKDPLEDHDAATKAYVDRLCEVRPSKTNGVYSTDDVFYWVASFDEQRLQVKIQPQINTEVSKSDNRIAVTDVAALVGDTDRSSGHGVCFNRPCYVNESGNITWIRGIDEEDGTQPNYVIVPSLYGSVSYDSSTTAICDANHGAITKLIIGNQKHTDDTTFMKACLLPRYPIDPSSGARPVSGAKYTHGYIDSNCTMDPDLLWYLQTMWLLKYANTYAGLWMDVGVGASYSTYSMLDPTTYGGEYGDYQDCIYKKWSNSVLYKQFPSGYKLTIQNQTQQTKVETEVLFTSVEDEDNSILGIYVMDYYPYAEGDTVKFWFTTPDCRLTGETDEWLNDGWQDASAFSGQFGQLSTFGGTSTVSIPISADTAISAYRLCNIELGLGASCGLGTFTLSQPDTSSWDYLEWELTTPTSETFKFPFYNLSGATSMPSSPYQLGNTLYLAAGSDGSFLWVPARLASDYQMRSYAGVMMLPYYSKLGASVLGYLSHSNEGVLLSSTSTRPAPFMFCFSEYGNQTDREWGTCYPKAKTIEV